ncbi:MAG: glycosyltransferase family 9 protein [Dysgonamonadaceae bacterium]|jgi:ADP-heptose:LPS heptosyltransferase|nr:glycosyltransferase family 9 protein [Dysgonamonadaceae bacterium]
MTITLVIRLSSIGDAAMLIPALYSVASKNPDDLFLLITKKSLQDLFFNKPDNLKVFPLQSQDRHKGLGGLIRAVGDINAVVNQYGGNSKPIVLQVADLHAVIRSTIIDFFFRLKGAKIAVVDKNRRDRRALVRRENKVFQPLQTVFSRYREVFGKLGYEVSVDFTGLYPKGNKKAETWIGIAPFAKHHSKTYPAEQMEEVVCILNSRPATKIFLFGGKEERRLTEEWAGKYEQVESVAGLMSFPDELSLMNRLDVMLCMDSANMHLGSLVNTPVVSVWGATHPYAGFYGYNQNPENAVQTDLPCRPCAIFGGKPCWRGDYPCLTGIAPKEIVEKINSLISLPSPVSETLQP